jgi:hypothetical protein
MMNQGGKMSKKEWAEEVVKLYFEGYTVAEADEIVRKMSKESKNG